jgi:hypothetical protein
VIAHQEIDISGLLPTSGTEDQPKVTCKYDKNCIKIQRSESTLRSKAKNVLPNLKP